MTKKKLVKLVKGKHYFGGGTVWYIETISGRRINTYHNATSGNGFSRKYMEEEFKDKIKDLEYAEQIKINMER